MEQITIMIPVEVVMAVAILAAFVVVSPLILRMTARFGPLPRMVIFMISMITVAFVAMTGVGLAWGV